MIHVSVALKLSWKIPVKLCFDPANTEKDHAISLRMMETLCTNAEDKVASRPFPHVYTHTCNNNNEVKVLKVTDVNKW